MSDEKLDSAYFQLIRVTWQLIGVVATLGALVIFIHNIYKGDNQNAILWGLVYLIIK